jgi:hypothetical protein
VSNEDAQYFAESIEQICGGNFTENEAVCPTTGEYVGTCISTEDEEKTKVHYYQTDRVEVARSSCEDGDNQTWKVE